MGQSIGILDYVDRSRPRYPFRQLMQGDWFEVETTSDEIAVRVRKSLSVAAVQFARSTGWKFKVQRRSDRVIRVWRIDGLTDLPYGCDGRFDERDIYEIINVAEGLPRRIKCLSEADMANTMSRLVENAKWAQSLNMKIYTITPVPERGYIEVSVTYPKGD